MKIFIFLTMFALSCAKNSEEKEETPEENKINYECMIAKKENCNESILISKFKSQRSGLVCEGL